MTTTTKPGGLLAQALRTDDLDEAIFPIMAALGILTGDVAGQCFSRTTEVRWLDMDLDARAEAIAAWLDVETTYAAAAVMEAP